MNKTQNEAYKWFDLKNYDELTTISVGHFCRELFSRVELIRKRQDFDFQMMLRFQFPQIIDGKVLFNTLIPCSIDTLNIKDDLEPPEANTRYLGVLPCTKGDIESIHKYIQNERTLLFIYDHKLKKDNLCEKCNNILNVALNNNKRYLDANCFCNDCAQYIAANSSRPPKQHTPLIEPSNSNKLWGDLIKDRNDFIDLSHHDLRNSALVRLDLETFTDAELLMHIKHQLPMLRKLFKQPEPRIQNQRKSTEKHLIQMIKNSFTHRLIPILDLDLFDQFTSLTQSRITTVTKAQILDLVFPDQPNREKDWVRKFIRKEQVEPLLTANTIENILTFVACNPEIRDAQMDEFC